MFLRGRRWSLRLKNKTIVISFDFVAMGKFLKTDEIFWSIGQIAGYYFHVVVLWVKLQATVLGVCWAIFLSL